MSRSLTRSQRRMAVVVQLLSYPLVALLGHWLALPGALTLLVGLSGYAAASCYLYWGTGLWHYGNAPDPALDERQVQVRNHAYRLAYATVSALVILALAYAIAAPILGWATPAIGEQGSSLLWVALVFLPSLPSALLAWNEVEL